MVKDLFKQGISFGGTQLTLTDIHRQSSESSKEVLTFVERQIKKLIDQFEEKFPIVVVGGGASLFQSEEILIPSHHTVANAYGAAIAQPSYTVTKVLPLANREENIESLKQEIFSVLGKDALIDLIEVTPIHYLTGHFASYLMRGCCLKN